LCPSLEDFVTQRTLTKCGPKCAPCWRTLSHCRLWFNVVWTYAPRWRTLSHSRLQPNVVQSCSPSTEGFFLLQSLTTQSTIYSSSKKARTKQTDSNHWSKRNWNCHLQLRCHVINTLRGIPTNKPWQRNDGSHVHHTTNDKWCGSHTTITDTAS
jgi:hypothetical protein